MNCKLAEVEAGRAAEYLDPLAVLLENMQVRTKVAGEFDYFTDPFSPPTVLILTACIFYLSGIYKELCLESVRNKYECEIQATCQHWEVRNTDNLLRFS